MLYLNYSFCIERLPQLPRHNILCALQNIIIEEHFTFILNQILAQNTSSDIATNGFGLVSRKKKENAFYRQNYINYHMLQGP